METMKEKSYPQGKLEVGRKNLTKMLAVKIPKCSLNASILTQRAMKVQDCRFTMFQKT